MKKRKYVTNKILRVRKANASISKVTKPSYGVRDFFRKELTYCTRWFVRRNLFKLVVKLIGF